MVSYSAIYRHHGVDYSITIHNDGKTLSFWLGGWHFYGESLSYMQTDRGLGDYSFSHHYGDLCDCQFLYSVPQLLMGKDGKTYSIDFVIEHRLGKPCENGGLDDETIIIRFDFQGQTYQASGGFYEDVLLELQRQLGQGFYFKNCFGCLYGDYSIFGQGAFGDLKCFYTQKDAYLKAKEKHDYIPLYDNAPCVQETGCCVNFML